MVRITPCRNLISDRFSVASFVVQVPPECLFEIACATDPALFRPDQRHRRTPRNFATSRHGGLLRAPAGHATYVVPPEHLRRFAGTPRLYYAVGTYRGAHGEDARFSIDLDAVREVPYIQLAPDFTGKHLDRSRLRGAVAEARYGGPGAEALVWGADLVAAARPQPAPAPRVGTVKVADYDDGFDAALWDSPKPVHGAPAADPRESEDAPDLCQANAVAVHELSDEPDEPDEPDRDGNDRSFAEPSDFEDAVAFSAYRASHGGNEPEGHEDGRSSRPSPGASGPGRDAPRFGRAPREDAAPRFGGADAEDDALAPPGPAAGFDAEFTELADGPAPALSPADRVRIGDGVFAALYGSSLYDHAYANERAGLVWGAAGFSQANGSLGEVLAIACRRDPDAFVEIFGDGADELLRVTRSGSPAERLAPVDGRTLRDPDWLERFRRAGRHPAFAAAQREAADVLFFQPALPFARFLGLDREPDLALLFDRCTHMGVGAGCRFVLEHAYPALKRRDLAPALRRLGAASLSEVRGRAGLSREDRFDALTAAVILGELQRQDPVTEDPYERLVRGEEQVLGDAVATPERREIARRIVRIHRSGRFTPTSRFTL